MTESSEQALSKAGYPRAVYTSAAGRLRQGDLFWSYAVQLRLEDDPPGPGSNEIDSDKIPWVGPFEDSAIAALDHKFQVRVWGCWVMAVTQSCDLDYQDERDSRMAVAPVVFRSKWQGKQWEQILPGNVPGFLYLPSMSKEEKAKVGAPGWPVDEGAAVVLGSTCLISRQIAGKPKFGLSNEMRALLQERLVVYSSVRNWTTSGQFERLKGKRIEFIQATDEKFDGPGRLFKVTLGNGDEDEATVGLVLPK